MLTEAADDEFLGVTHHDRMPALIDQDAIGWLPGDPGGTLSAIQSPLTFDE
jgi:hypothetical protein